jgi:GntR family transcriptional regulator/MocR family aminotransferase
MSSPVNIPFLSFIALDRGTNTPIYLQLAQQLMNAIQRGYLTPGAKMPGSRSLSELLSLHRKTVIASYEDLHQQGWIKIVPNKGAFVMDNKTKITERRYDALVALANYPTSTGYSFKQSNLLDNPFEQSNCTYQWNDGLTDVRLTQFSELSSMYSASMKRKTTQSNLRKNQDSDFFKQQLSNYLNSSRGLHISKDNLLITHSTEMSLYIIAQLVISPNDVVIVGELGLFTANMIFQTAQASVQTIDVDEQGIDVDALEAKLKTTKVKAVYITPHHHYPTTVMLSAARRVKLLKLAQQHGFVIIEDDYDYDFQYEKTTIMPLASADLSGMVIYIGTFGKSLAPSFSTGFVVAPKNLISEMHKYLALIYRHGDVMMEQVLGEMIAEGNIHRHLKKSLKIYRERRDNCCALLAKHFGHSANFSVPNGGLAVWLEWNAPLSLLQLAKACQRNDLFIPKTVLYQNKKTTAMRIGFGHLTMEEMEKSLEIIAGCVAG